MRLSKHFRLQEFLKSDTARKNNILNIPPDWVKENLAHLCENVLEPVRVHFNAPVRITSGYRSPELNRAVGGSETSQHKKGEAADFVVQGHTVQEVYDFIRTNLIFDQCIQEYDRWIHVSFSEENRNQSWEA